MSAELFTHTVIVPCSILTTLVLPQTSTETIYATREDEAIAIGSGLAVGGMHPLVAFQNSGLANALNTLGSLAIAYRVSLTVLVTMRGTPSDANPTQIPVGAATRGFLDGLGVPHRTVRHPATLEQGLREADDIASTARTPSFVLFEGVGTRD